jgi:Domain of unknown function (DUF4357)
MYYGLHASWSAGCGEQVRMTDNLQSSGRTIQLFLTDGTPNGLIVASIRNWTGRILVASQSTFDRLLARSELDRPGVYIFYGPDPKAPPGMRAYIGEADNVRERIDSSAKKRDFWESVAVITTSDDAINKGHARYLEARLIELARTAGRVSLANSNEPPANRKRLSEADRADMERFLEDLKIILPVIGLDLLKPRPSVRDAEIQTDGKQYKSTNEMQFEIRHKSGVKACAVEAGGEFVVLPGSHALKDPGYARNSYAGLKANLISQGVLVVSGDGKTYQFTSSYGFKSPSAAGSVILDRNTNGRTRWHLSDSNLNYHEWQEKKAELAREHQPSGMEEK